MKNYHRFLIRCFKGRIEIVISSVGAFVAIFLIIFVSSFLLEGKDIPLIVASMGAAAVLLFAAPDNRMSQPWPLFAGHVVSAITGVSCAQYIPDLALASALAVGGAILLMHLTQSMHPPGGAAALVAVIGGESFQSLGYGYILAPVMLNVVVIFVVALVVNNLVPGRRYPVRTSDDGNAG